MSKYIKTTIPIYVGHIYTQGISIYRVLQYDPVSGHAELCRPTDGWTLLARHAALYDTDAGLQLMWDWSTCGRFEESNIER